MSTSKKNRIQQINEMLLQMATGNLSFRLKLLAKNDQLEAFSNTLNMLAEEIQDTMKHEGYVNSLNPIIEIVQLVVILDEAGMIEMANHKAFRLLSGLSPKIIGMPFASFLEPSSHDIWNSYWKQRAHQFKSDITLELKFRNNGSLVIPITCYITTFKGKKNSPNKTHISTIYHATTRDYLSANIKEDIHQFQKKQKKIANETAKHSKKSKPRLSFEDIRKIRKGHQFIINNLEKDFPSLKDFALQLGTNEFKLKYGFKELYSTTVHRFLMNERFRKAHMMIQFYDQSFKSIAHMTGFKSISHFSRTFKEKFGYTPSELRKKSLNKDF